MSGFLNGTSGTQELKLERIIMPKHWIIPDLLQNKQLTKKSDFYSWYRKTIFEPYLLHSGRAFLCEGKELYCQGLDQSTLIILVKQHIIILDFQFPH